MKYRHQGFAIVMVLLFSALMAALTLPFLERQKWLIQAYQNSEQRLQQANAVLRLCEHNLRYGTAIVSDAIEEGAAWRNASNFVRVGPDSYCIVEALPRYNRLVDKYYAYQVTAWLRNGEIEGDNNTLVQSQLMLQTPTLPYDIVDRKWSHIMTLPQ